jgi:uncharacterized glyoxalase superfamily protein PhnB
VAEPGGWRACPILGVQDVRDAAALMQRELGFRIRAIHGDVPPEDDAVYAILERENTEIHLQIRRREPPSSDRGSFENDVFVRVADVDPVYDELRQRGARVLRPPIDEPYGMRDFVVSGPENYRLLFGSRMDEADA